MILYSPAKINIGLHILRKREDNFHDIISLMYPLPFYDIIEIQADFDKEREVSFTNSGIIVPGTADSNLCSKAVQLFVNASGKTAEVKIHLHKLIPFGAGLGGGSSNASAVLTALNSLSGSQLKRDQLIDLAARLGSDCPLFIYDKPMMAYGRGEILEETGVNLNGYYLVLVNPEIVVPTTEAYSKVLPNSSRPPLSETLRTPISQWKNSVSNDFEKSEFHKYPMIEKLKLDLYDNGAIYSSMSGSGSSVYGLYLEQPKIQYELEKLVIWKGWI
jgi:4-diphosphocytidyl-2-C-methyl-D-erythritol kinase